MPSGWKPLIKLPLYLRIITYALFFIGLVLIYVPAQILTWTGIAAPSKFAVQRIAGALLGGFGGAITLWCILVFAMTGGGTPAPFDPPGRLVVEGPYRYVRNPMYVGAALTLAGAALFWDAWPLLVYAVLFLLVAHLFIITYEEPTLRRSFGRTYEDYCRHVRRWWPHPAPHHDAGDA